MGLNWKPKLGAVLMDFEKAGIWETGKASEQSYGGV